VFVPVRSTGRRAGRLLLQSDTRMPTAQSGVLPLAIVLC
jgi:hypothetical protein